MDFAFKTYAELKLRCRGLRTWLSAGSAPDECTWAAPEQRSRVDVELIESRLMMSGSSPPAFSVPASASTDENTSLVFSSANSNAISLTDAAAGSNADNVTISVTHGTLTLKGSTGLTFTVGAASGSSSLAFSGTVANINAALGGMQFVPASGYTGSSTMQFAVTDPTDALSGSASTAVTIAADPVAVNDTGYEYNEDQTLTVNGPGVLGNDSDSNGHTLTAVQLTEPANGKIDWNPTGLGTLTNLTGGASASDQPKFSPDGTKIVYSSAATGSYQIYAMNSDGSNVVQLTNSGATNIQPSWSPDGTKIAFYSDRGTTPDIWVMNSDGSNLVQLTNGSGVDGQPVWSPDGSKICFTSNRGGNYELYVMSSTGANVTQITTLSGTNSEPSWSADGTKIAFASNSTGTYQIYEVNPDGTGLARITNNSNNDSRPTWNPTSNRLAFMSDRSGSNALCVMNADGSYQVELTGNIGTEDYPNWSADGTKFAIESNGQIAVATVLSDGGFNYFPNTGSTGTDSFTYSAYDGVTTSSPATVTLAMNPPLTLTVTNTNDSGTGSLRQAITSANAAGPGSNIVFDIAGSGVHTIALASALPLLLHPLIAIDGTTQPGYSGTPLIQIDGTSAGTGANGIEIDAHDCTIKGLTISNFSGNGINIDTADNAVVQSNYLGTDATGTVAAKDGDGVVVAGGSGALIGGASASLRNVISGNFNQGILIDGAASQTTVEGNYIGLNAAGTAAVPNGASNGGAEGILISGGATGVVVGGTSTAAANVISGNDGVGVEISGSGTSGNVVEGNDIGTSAAGTAGIPNTTFGVEIDSGASSNTIGGATSSDRNIISGNGEFGLNVTGSNTASNLVENNYIGTTATGLAALSNGSWGVVVTNSAAGTTVESNVISGNTSISAASTGVGGIYVAASNTTIASNLIGLAEDGTTSLPDGNRNASFTAGIYADNGTSGVSGLSNSIANNVGAGVAAAAGASDVNLSQGSYFNNSGLAIDLNNDGVTANTGVKNSGLANDGMNFPVVTGATVSGTSLTVQGYVGSSANEAAFAGARVEIFETATNASGYGQGKTYLGDFTAGSAGSFGGSLTVSGFVHGDYITATATDASGNTSEFGANVLASGPPTVATAASASPSPVTGTSTALSVLGADDSGETTLTYTWATTGTPPAAVTFSANGTNAAKATTATFTSAGTYNFQVTITDAQGRTATSSVSVVVNQQLEEIIVLPSIVSVPVGTTQQCTAAGYDQFGNAFTTAPTFTWSVTGGGTINQSGLYTAPSVSGDYPVIKVTSGSCIGLSQLITVASSADVVPPGANTGTSASLNVSGYSSSYIYTWSLISMPTGAPSPTASANQSSAAYQTTITFYKAGLYVYTCTFGNADGSGTRYCATFESTMEQAATAITVSPSTAALHENGTQSFSATATDQFGAGISPEPAFTWAKASGVGSINSSGLYTAATNTGSASVTATSGSAVGSASITVTNATPTVATAAAASPSPVTGTTTALSVLGADDGGEGNLTYTWATTGTPPASVAFSANSTNAAKNTTATFTKAGVYNFQVTIKDAGGLTTTSSVSVTVNQTVKTITLSPTTASLHENQTKQFAATGYDQFGTVMATQPTFTWAVSSGSGSVSTAGLFTAPYAVGSNTVTATSGSVVGSATISVSNATPTVATAAAASPSPITGTTTALSVLGADDGGESNLTYTWVTSGSPPAAVTFSANGTNAAKNTTATFTKAGSYGFKVTITDAGGLSTTSSVSVNVNQALKTIVVSPATAALNENQTQQFTAVGDDQFGTAMSSQPTFTWAKASGIGSLSTSGLYTSPASAGMAAITATSGSVVGTAAVTVTNATPTVATAAAAAPSPVTGTATALSVLGADDGGESNLIYTWATTGTPPAAVVFSANGTNAAKSTTATFAKAGTYNFQVTITDAGGLSATSSVSVAVNQTLKGISISPATVSLNENQTEQFTATAVDQFGIAMSSVPTITWSKTSGVGSINSTGLYTAPAGTGSAAVTATSGAISGSASITVTNAAPTVATPAAATPNPVTATTTALSVLGADDGGASNLTYTWATTGTPPTGVTFSANATNAAKNTTATFTKAGSYSFQVTIADTGGLSTTSAVTVTVNQTISTITVSPASAALNENQTQQFTATGYDQFGTVMSANPTFTWSKVSGVGSINTDGLYAAPNGTGIASITAISASISGSASISVTNAAPTVATPASATPSPVNGTTTTLKVLGADDGGESNLTYTWATTGVPPAAVSFSANATNAAKNTTATFTKVGTYNFLVTITDAGGLSTTSAVSVTVNQTLATIAVSPATSSLNENQTQQFSAVGHDQFGNSIATQPTFTWSNSAGVGTVSSSGLYTSPLAAGSTIVSATSGSVSGSASITVTNAAPTVATAAAASPATVTGTSTALSVLGADDGGESNLAYSWSVSSKPTGAAVPSFSANGTNAAKSTTVTFSGAGTYVFEATITDAGGLSTTSSATVTVDQTFTSIAVSPANPILSPLAIQQFSATALDQFGQNMASQPAFTWASTGGLMLPTGLLTAPPTAGSFTVTATSGSVIGSSIVTIAGSDIAVASPSPVTGNTTTLSVNGGSTIGVTYTWSVLSEPTGATDPTFSANNSSAAQTTTATFFAAGNYTFQVSIAAGSTSTQTVPVTVDQTLSTIDVAPGSSNLNENGKQVFTAVGFDQFDKAMLTQPNLSWSVSSGGGTIDSGGTYTAAGSNGAGSATIAATSGAVSGSASVAVTNAAPTVATAAAASPLTVTAESTLLSVLGADDGGESNLSYTWSTTGTPPAPVTFSSNGTNAAKDSTATFTKAGAYQFAVTITDVEGLTVTSTVNVTVAQTLAHLALSPASTTVTEGSSQQFSATAIDQFGNSMALPSLLWSIPSGTGSIDSTGLYTAANTSGPTIVKVSSGSIRATATITVPNQPPSVATSAAATPGVVTGHSTTLSVLGADDGGESNLTYTWSSTGSSPASVVFSVNASNAAKNTTAQFTQAGGYQLLVTITDAQGLSVTSTVDVTVNQTLTSLALSPQSVTVAENATAQFSASAVDQFGNSMQSPSLNWSINSGGGSIDNTGLYTAPGTFGSTVVSVSSGSISATAIVTIPNRPPTVATASAASPDPVNGTSTVLSVLAADDGAQSNLTYNWATTGTPPAPVSFSTNASNAAKNTTATFTKAGGYQFTVTVTDAQGLSVTSSVNVTVSQTLTTLLLSPPSSTVAEGASQPLSADAVDQFGNPMLTPSLTWSVASGGGTIDSSGLFMAGGSPGAVTVSAANGSITGRATINVPNQPPIIVNAASGSPSLVITTSTALGVLGADDGGEPNLTYAWSTIGTPPAPVAFSANGSNAAKNVTANFSAAGAYDFVVTITDAEGATATSSVNVVVTPVLTSVAASPADVALGRGQTVQFSAKAYDQFGVLFPIQPGFAWSTGGGSGSIDASGRYTAPTAGSGSIFVVATTANASGTNVSGTASINLVDGLSASAPTSVDATPGTPVVFAGNNAISIADADPVSASVPVSITVSATHGSVSLSGMSGLTFQNGTSSNGTLLTFAGNISDVDKALRGMAYTSEAGFTGSASLTVTINETGTANASPTYPIAIQVSAPATSLTTGGSVATNAGSTASGTTAALTTLVSGTSSPAEDTTASQSAYSSNVVVSGGSFGDVAITSSSSSSSGSVQTTPAPTPAPAATPAPTPAAAPAVSPAKSTVASVKPVVAAANTPANVAANAAVVFASGGPGSAITMPFSPSSPVPDVRVEAVPEQVFAFLGAKSEMSKEMDVANHKLVAEGKLKVVAGSATVASFGASAAYVLWMLRGGSLLSSLLSILPAWQSIDPLPVLDNFESNKRRKRRLNSDDESLESIESMVDKSNSKGERAEADTKPDSAKIESAGVSSQEVS